MDFYLYPGTLVLNNKFGLRDPELLANIEADATSRRILLLEFKPSPSILYVPDYLEIHRYIFQDMYTWAGKVRTVDLARPGQMSFARTENIDLCLRSLFDSLCEENFLRELDIASFCNRAAYFLGELNAIHPFRDGNGRTQRAFISQLARGDGFAIRWFQISREEMYTASQRSFQYGDSTEFEHLLQAATYPTESANEIYPR